MDLAQKPVYKLDLAAGTSVVNLTTPLVEGDDRAQTFTLELTDKGAPANLDGYSVTAYFGRGKTAEAEADTIPLSGTVSGNVATITLTESCYSRSCYFSMPIRLSNGATGQKRTYLIVRGTVVKSVDGTIIDPDGSVPTLDDLFAQIAVMERSRQAAEEATEEALAAAARADEAREEIQGELAALTEDIDNSFALPVTWEDGAYINSQGLVIPFDGYSFGTVDVQKIGDISIATVCYDKTTCAFYNDNGAFISAAPFNDLRENPYRLLLTVPKNARHLKFSCMTYAKDDASAKIANVPAQIRAVMGGVGAVTIAGDGQNLTNADDALPNTIYSIQQGGGIVSNLPMEQGTLVTFSYAASEVAGRVQLFVDADNRFFWRIRWQDWRDWREVVDLSTAVIDIRDAINIAIGGDLSQEWVDGYYINGYNNGEIPSYTGTRGMSYAKVDVSTIRGCDVTFSTNTQSRATYAFYNASMQCVKGCDLEFVEADGINTFKDAVPFTAKYLCVSSYTDNKADFNIKAGNVSNAASRLYEHLSDNGNPLEHVTGTPGMADIFRKFCCIGDSLASGEHEYIKEDGKIGYIDLYEYSWGQYMARAVGGTCYNLSKGGATTRTWLAEFASRLPETLSDCYIIALGVNDANPDSRNVPVGSMADCHATNHTLNADTYYGNYDQIIRRIHTVQPRAKIFCVTNPQGGASAAYDSTYNQAVRDMVAKHDNCYLIDLWAHAPVYDAAFRARYFNGGHMNAAGYLYTAHMFMSYIDWHVKNNPTDFAEVAFIGTDYSRQ